MGFYYMDEPPPEKQSRWGRFIPRWLRNWWADTTEVFAIIRLVFGIMLPVVGVLFGFVLLFALFVFVLNLCGSGGR